MTGLLEGLEATITKASELERTLRLDAEYFRKEFLRTTEVLSLRHNRKVADLANISDGNHFAISDQFVEVGVPYYRGQDVTGRIFVESSAPTHITQEAYNQKYI